MMSMRSGGTLVSCFERIAIIPMSYDATSHSVERVKKYNESQAIQIYEQADPNGTLGLHSLIMIAKEHGGNFPYEDLTLPIDFLSKIDDVPGLRIQYIDSEYLMTSATNGVPIEGLPQNVEQGKLVFIKSANGSAKTDLLKYLCKQARMKNSDVCSVVARQVLAVAHAKSFRLANYLDEETKRSGRIDAVWCLDSIHKIVYGDNHYILLIDEFNSVVSDLKKLHGNISKVRYQYIEKLHELMLMSEMVVCVDADLTTEAVKFGCRLVKEDGVMMKEATLIVNTHKPKPKCSVRLLHHREALIRNIITEMKSNRSVFVCSDAKENFYCDVVSRIREEFAND